MTALTAAPFAYWGSKTRMAPWIIERLPAHEHYIEGCAGSAAVLAAKPLAPSETLNDTYGEVVNFFRVLRDPEMAAELIDQVAFTPYSREEFRGAFEVAPDASPVDRAWAFFVRMQQAMVPGKTGWKSQVQSPPLRGPVRWDSMPRHLMACAARFARVQIECLPVVELIARYDAPGVLFFVDPPYEEEARPKSVGSRSAYVHDAFDHLEFLAAVRSASHARFAITHYPSPLYDDAGLVVAGDFSSHRNNPAGTGRDVAIERLYLAGPPGADLEPATRPATLFGAAS